MNNKATKSFKIITIVCTILLMNWILTRPNLHKPFSDRSVWDEGYKMGYGEYPKMCPDYLCKVHHKGFWGEFFSKN